MFWMKKPGRKDAADSQHEAMQVGLVPFADTESWKDRRIESIKAALARPRLEGLQFGDVIRQKKLGLDYKYQGDETPMVFVRYATNDDIRNESNERAPNNDIVIASYVDIRDGELPLFLADSSRFERV